MPNLSRLAHDRGAGLQPAGPIWGSPDKRFGPARVTRDLFLPPGCGPRTSPTRGRAASSQVPHRAASAQQRGGKR